MFNIEENLKKLPETPGVYIHKDKLGQVIYVGKAINLRRRVRQYFRLAKNADAKVRAMVTHIAEFEYINCATEMEALILENNLIKKYQPKYNILLRDDKTYPYIKVTLNEKYPRVIKTRLVKEDGAKYFGPYSDGKAVNEIVEMLNEMLCLKRCSAVAFPSGMRACLNYHIKACRGICQGGVDEKAYRADIDTAIGLLSGKHGEIAKSLEAEMQKASDELRFEDAAVARDRLNAIKAISETQRATIPGLTDVDIVLTVHGKNGGLGNGAGGFGNSAGEDAGWGKPEIFVVVFYYRNGKLSGRETFPMQVGVGDDSPSIVSAFIKQYYGIMTSLPYEILVGEELPDAELVEGFLSKLAGRNIRILVPQRGDKRALLNMAKNDCVKMCESIDERAATQAERINSLSDEIYGLLREYYPDFEKKREYRIESYDISNTNGVDTVAGMVVFKGLRPLRKDYRRFRIKTVVGPDDYASLREVLLRRFRRAIEEDQAFSEIPDFLLIDGGKGQVTVVLEALDILRREFTGDGVAAAGDVAVGVAAGDGAGAVGVAAGDGKARRLAQILRMPVVGMAKDDNHRTSSAVVFKDGEFYETPLSEKPLLFRYMGTVQEEVHRFAIEYHRKIRGKHMITSVLDEIPGIGPVKRNALLEHFKSIDAVKRATRDELMEVGCINEKNATDILEFFTR